MKDTHKADKYFKFVELYRDVVPNPFTAYPDDVLLRVSLKFAANGDSIVEKPFDLGVDFACRPYPSELACAFRKAAEMLDNQIDIIEKMKIERFEV